MARSLILVLLTALVACADEERSTDARPVPLNGKTVHPKPAVESKPPVPKGVLLRAIPRSALAVGYLPDGGSAWDKLAATVYGPLVGGTDAIDVATMLRPWFDEIRLRHNGPDATALPPWTDLDAVIQALNGEYMLALLDVDGIGESSPEVRVLAGATVHGAAMQAESVLRVLAKLTEETFGCTVERTSEIWRISAGLPPVVYEFAVEQDSMLFGVGRGVVADAVRRMRGNERYDLASVTRCFQLDDIARLHINLSECLKRFSKFLDPRIRKAIESLRLDHVRSYSAALRIDGQKINSRTFLDSPGGFDLFTRMTAANPVNFKILENLPAELSSFTLFTFSPAWVVRTLKVGLPPEQAAAFQALLEKLDPEGRVLREKPLAMFGPQCAEIGMLATQVPETSAELVMSSIDNTAWLIELSKANMAHNLLNLLAEAIPTRRRYRVRSAEAVTFDLRLPSIEGIEISPSFGITHDHLYFAFSSNALRRALEPPTQRSAEEYKSMLVDLPESVASVSFDSMGAASLTTTALQALGMQPWTRGGPANEKIKLLQATLNHPGPALAYTTVDDTGITTFSTSPTGGFSGIGGLLGASMAAAVAVPNLVAARTVANETSAVALLSNIRAAQEQFRARAIVDRDGDREGEYGYLGELMNPRQGQPLVKSLPGAGGRYMHSGYIFRVYLPSRSGLPIGETSTRSDEVDANLAERFMLATAWPVEKGTTGQRAFVLNTAGEIFYCAEGSYGGRNAPPPDVLCFEPGNMMSRTLPNGVVARDGLRWFAVK